jgi:hypothetical protein
MAKGGGGGGGISLALFSDQNIFLYLIFLFIPKNRGKDWMFLIEFFTRHVRGLSCFLIKRCIRIEHVMGSFCFLVKRCVGTGHVTGLKLELLFSHQKSCYDRLMMGI